MSKARVSRGIAFTGAMMAPQFAMGYALQWVPIRTIVERVTTRAAGKPHTVMKGSAFPEMIAVGLTLCGIASTAGVAAMSVLTTLVALGAFVRGAAGATITGIEPVARLLANHNQFSLT
jgi:hypothetical protein